MIHNAKGHFGTLFVHCLDTPQTIVIAVHLPQLPRLDYRQACESLSGIHPTENLEHIRHEWNQTFRWTNGRAVVPNGCRLKRDGYIPHFQRFSNSRADIGDFLLNVSIPWRRISLVGGERASGPMYL